MILKCIYVLCFLVFLFWVVVEPGILAPSNKMRLAETLFVISCYNIVNSDICRKSRKSFVLAEANLLQMQKTLFTISRSGIMLDNVYKTILYYIGRHSLHININII